MTANDGDFVLRDAADRADLFDPELAATLRDMAADFTPAPTSRRTSHERALPVP